MLKHHKLCILLNHLQEDFPLTPSAVYSKRLLANAEGRFDQDIGDDEDNHGEDPLLAAATSAHHVRTYIHLILVFKFLSLQISHLSLNHVVEKRVKDDINLLNTILTLFMLHRCLSTFSNHIYTFDRETNHISNVFTTTSTPTPTPTPTLDIISDGYCSLLSSNSSHHHLAPPLS